MLALYAIKVAGLSGFSGFTAIGMVGSMAAAALTTPLATRVSGRTLLKSSAAGLTLARLASYGFIAADAGLAPVLAMRLVGGICGTVMTNCAKAQVTDEESPGASIAALNVSNGLGQAAGALVAGAVTAWGPSWAAIAVGVACATLSNLPMARLARHAEAATAPEGLGLAALRGIGPTAALGAAVGMSMGALGSLRDGFTVELYGEAWLSAVSIAVMAGGLLAAPLTARVGRWTEGAGRDGVAWPMIGALALCGWAAASLGVGWFLIAAAFAELATQVVGALTEARIVRLSDRRHATQALTAAGALASLCGAAMVMAAPYLVGALGQTVTAQMLAVPLTLAAAVFAVRAGMLPRARPGRSRRFPPAGVAGRFPPAGVASRFPPAGVASRFPPAGVAGRFP